MTYDDLLDKIDEWYPTKWNYALRSVAKLHYPSHDGKFCDGCWEITGGDFLPIYPCETIQAIERELK